MSALRLVRRARVRLRGVADVQVGAGVYSIGYGRRVENARIAARLTGGRAHTSMVFEAVGETG